MTAFTKLEILRSKFPNLIPFHTQSWVYAGLTAYFSQIEKFHQLEFSNDMVNATPGLQCLSCLMQY